MHQLIRAGNIIGDSLGDAARIVRRRALQHVITYGIVVSGVIRPAGRHSRPRALVVRVKTGIAMIVNGQTANYNMGRDGIGDTVLDCGRPSAHLETIAISAIVAV